MRAWNLIAALSGLAAPSSARAEAFPATGGALFDLLTAPPVDLAIGAALMGLLWYLSVRRTRRNLAESEARFNALMEASADGILVHQNDLIVYANTRMARMLGYEAGDDLIGQGAYDFLPENRRTAARERRQRREAGENMGLIKGEIIGLDGLRLDTERSGALTSWRGRPAHLVIVCDISERRVAESVRERILAALEHMPSAVAVFDADERLIAWNGEFAMVPAGMRSLINRGVSFEEILRGRVAHGEAPPEIMVSPERVEEWISERLSMFRNMDGPIEMFMRGQWRQVRNDRLPDGGIVLISADITDIKQREQALAASEARFRGVFENSGICIVLVDDHARYLRANQAYREFVGYDEHELAFMKTSDLAVPEDKAKIDARIARLLAGDLAGIQDERRYVRKDGEIRWALVIVRAVELRDEPRMFVAMVHDITNRKRAEEALAASEARFRSVFQAGGAGIVLLGADRRFVAANRAFCDFVGYTEDELKAMSPLDLAVPEDQPVLGRRLDAMASGVRGRYVVERRYIHRDGTVIWGVAHLSALPSSETGEHFLISVVQDITDRKNAEQALLDSEARFRDFAEATSDVFWETGPDHRFTSFASDADPFRGGRSRTGSAATAGTLPIPTTCATTRKNAPTTRRIWMRTDRSGTSSIRPATATAT
jgi:PAS domain S-box-containing protein